MELRPEDVSLLERCPHFRGCYVQASMELGPEDVSLLERCPHFRGCYVQASMELGPEDVSLLERTGVLISEGVYVQASLKHYNFLFQARARNLSGNLAGDGLQNGGLLIVAKGGGQVLLNHCEETPGDHVVNSVVLDTLGISPAEATRLAVNAFRNPLLHSSLPPSHTHTHTFSLPPSFPSSFPLPPPSLPSHQPSEQ